MDFIKNYISVLALILIAVYALSLFARWHWFFALLSNFIVQYFAGAIILLPFLILLNQDILLSVFMIVIAMGSYAQIRAPMSNPLAFFVPISDKADNKIKIAQYNKYYKNHSYKQIGQWAENNKIDLIIMQEVHEKYLNMLDDELLKIFPYALPKGSERPNYVVIYSKYPIENLTIKSICGDICETKGLRFTISPFDEEKITVYSVHTEAPIGAQGYKENFAELNGMAQWIASDNTPNTIFMGDWNSTPYSPAFKNMLQISKLNYQNYDIFPETTWPSFAVLPFLKIPIDHILFSNDLVINSINRDKAIGSDHHSLIATFTLK